MHDRRSPDTTGAKVGEVAARLMERLEREFAEDESAQIESVFLVSAVRHDHGQRVTVHYDTSSGVAPHEGMGLLQYVRTFLQEKARVR